MLLYTPAVAAEDFDVAIAYLFRRLEENASEENFIHHLFGLEPGSAAFEAESAKFRTAVAGRWSVGRAPRRQQDRRREPEPADAAAGFFKRAGHRSRAGTQPGVGPRDRLPAMERPGHAPQPDH